jgi:hypothetical protein
MLVALVNPNWPEKEQQTIKDNADALADAEGHERKDLDDISTLADGEELWLYSHGGASTFAGVGAEKLVNWLVTKARMPEGERKIVLKGCRTMNFAAAATERISIIEGYKRVVFWGFDGVASRTRDGEKQVRLGGNTEKKAQRKGALADLVSRRNSKKRGRTKEETDRRATKARRRTVRANRVFPAVSDEGSSMYVANDERKQRRSGREARKDPNNNNTDSGSDTD